MLIPCIVKLFSLLAGQDIKGHRDVNQYGYLNLMDLFDAKHI